MNYRTYELTAKYDSRKSFYGKAVVREYGDGMKELYSYQTLVARIYPNGSVENNLTFRHSQTTNRHIKEFYLQNGIKR